MKTNDYFRLLLCGSLSLMAMAKTKQMKITASMAMRASPWLTFMITPSMAKKQMTPEIGRDYLGPLGRTYRVEEIEDPDGYPLVVIRNVVQGSGTIRFPLNQAAKWLSPVDQSGHEAIGAAAYAE